MQMPTVCGVLGCPWTDIYICMYLLLFLSGLGWVEGSSGACSYGFFLFLEYQAYCYAMTTLALVCHAQITFLFSPLLCVSYSRVFYCL